MSSKLHWFLFFLAAPVLGLYLAFYHMNPFHSLPIHAMTLSSAEAEKEIQTSKTLLSENRQLIRDIQQGAEQTLKDYQLQQQHVDKIIAHTTQHTKKSEDVLDQYLTSLLGTPFGQTITDRVTIKVFSLEESGYRGYMAKIRLHDPTAVKMVLAHDSISSEGETTSHAAKRKNAVLAVNAGGFRKNEQGKVVPLGITVVDGKVKTFSTNTDLSFIGFNQQGKLVGGKITTRQQLDQLGVMQGASFLPTLLKEGKSMPIPREWANQKHPRTMIGHFTNGDVLVIVIDGRRKGWSQGVTLEEAQRKLKEFKVRDAYNLDGGGSSVFYYNGRVLNRPSDGKERPVSTNLVITK